MQEILKDILDSEFELIDYLEPKPIEKCKGIDPVFWEVHQNKSQFYILHIFSYL